MAANRKGDRRERQLVNALDEAGFAVMRAPASGSATDRELPDVLAGNGAVFYAIEAKSSAGDPIYLDSEEIEALRYFADSFGAKPRIGVRFDREEWAFFHPADIITENDAYRVKKELAVDDGEPLEELWVDGPDTQARREQIEGILEALDRGVMSVEEAVASLL